MDFIKTIWEEYRKYCLLGICGLIAVGILVHSQLSANKQTPPATMSHQNATIPTANHSSTKESTKGIVVDVKGAVQHPGVFKLQNGMRVQDAIALAGGVATGADVNHVNMAQALTDQQVIYVPMQGEDTSPIGSLTTGNSGSSQANPSPIINLNSASKEQLTQITGIGDKKADLILQYRQAHGQFKSVDELKNVSGFGDKSVDKIRDQVSI